MPTFFRTLPLIALLGVGTTLSAQDSTDTANDDQAAQTEEQAADTAEGSGESGSDGLDMGQEVAEDPSYIKEQYGDWQLQCFRAETGEDPCQMYQLLREDGGNPVAEFSLFKLPSNSQAVAGATIAVPLGTLLPEGLKLAVDGAKAKEYSYSFCSMSGCFARIGLTEADINALKAGAGATLTIVPAQAPDQTVVIKASLDGFTAAYNEVSIAPN